jgi:hypothetical protein
MVSKAIPRIVFAQLRNVTDRRTDSFTIEIVDLDAAIEIARASGFGCIGSAAAIAAVCFLIRQVAGNVYGGLMHKM